MGAAKAVQKYAEAEMDLLAECTLLLETVDQLQKCLGVLQEIFAKRPPMPGSLLSGQVDDAAERIQQLTEEFTNAVVEKYSRGDSNMKHSMMAMLYGLAGQADAAQAHEAEQAGDNAHDAEGSGDEEPSPDPLGEITKEFIREVRSKCQNCLAEITFCVGAVSASLSTEQNQLLHGMERGQQDLLCKMQQLAQKSDKREGILSELVTQHNQRLCTSLKEEIKAKMAGMQKETERVISSLKDGQQQGVRDTLRAICGSKQELKGIIEALEAAISNGVSDQKSELDRLVREIAMMRVEKEERDSLGFAAAPSASDIAQEVVKELKELKKASGSPQEGAGSSAASSSSSQEAISLGCREQYLQRKVYWLSDSEVKAENRSLGKGGQAQVVAGTYNGYAVAVKKYTVHGGHQERALVEGFLLRLASDLPEGRQRVVRCHGVHKHKDELGRQNWVIMELAEGSLQQALRSSESTFWFQAGSEANLADEHEAWLQPRREQWLSDVAKALLFLHTVLRIIHCDVKSGNVLLFAEKGRSGWRAKLSDLASCYQEKREDATMLVATTSGMSCTRRFAAPELLANPPLVTPKVDVWSFGMLMYEVLFRELPWTFPKYLGDFEIAGEMHSKRHPQVPSPLRWTPPQALDQLMRRDLCLRGERFRHPSPALSPSFLPAPRLPLRLTLIILLSLPPSPPSPPLSRAPSLACVHCRQRSRRRRRRGRGSSRPLRAFGRSSFMSRRRRTSRSRFPAIKGQARHCISAPVTAAIDFNWWRIALP